MVRTYLINSAGRIIAVSTNSKRIENLLNNSFVSKTIIPSYCIVEDGKPDFQIYLKEGEKRTKFRLDLTKRLAEISIPEKKAISDYQFSYFLLYLFQRLYQENDMYYLHGSYVSKGKAGTLLLGGEDSGKSRVALKLCLTYNFVINGDECLVFDNKTRRVIAGSSLMQMSKEKLDYFFSNENIHLAASNRERQKEILNTREMGLYSEVSEPITRVFYVHLNPYIPRFIELEPFDAQLSLYRDMSEDIRGVGYALLNLNKPLPSLDTYKLAKKRFRVVCDLVKEGIKVYSIRGNLEEICRTIS